MRYFPFFAILILSSFFSVAFAQFPGVLPLAARTVTPIYHCLDGGILISVLPLNIATAAWPFLKYDFKVSVPFTRLYGTFALPTAPIAGTMIPGPCLIFPFPPVFIPAQIILWNGSGVPLAP